MNVRLEEKRSSLQSHKTPENYPWSLKSARRLVRTAECGKRKWATGKQRLAREKDNKKERRSRREGGKERRAFRGSVPSSSSRNPLPSLSISLPLSIVIFLLHFVPLLLLLHLPSFLAVRSSPGTREIFVRIKAPGINIPRSREGADEGRGRLDEKGDESRGCVRASFTRETTGALPPLCLRLHHLLTSWNSAPSRPLVRSSWVSFPSLFTSLVHPSLSLPPRRLFLSFFPEFSLLVTLARLR